jgi:hypothetical protein
MSKEKDYIKFQLRRKITNLFKNFFFILEDIASDNKSISNEKYQQIRKRVLDYGNDTIREIEEDIDKFNISL